MNVREEMAERRLDAILAEVHAGGASAELAVRIAQRLQAEPVPRRQFRLVAALLMAAGLVVVVGTAWLGGGEGASRQAQDPAPADAVLRIETATVRATIAPVAEPPTGDAVDRLLAVASLAKACVIVAPGVKGESKCRLEGMGWRESVDRIAAEIGVGVASYGDAVVVGVGLPVEAKRCEVTAKFAAAPVHHVLKKLAIANELELVVAADERGLVAGVDRRLELDVEAVPVHGLLEAIAAKVGLEVVPVGRVFVLRRPGPVVHPDRVAMNRRNAPIAEVFDLWAQVARGNVVIDAAVQGSVTVRGFGSGEHDWLAALPAAVGAEVEFDRGILRLVPRVPLPTSVTLAAEGVEGVEVVRTTGTPGARCTIEPGGGRVNVFAWHVDARDLLHAVALATGRRMVRRAAGYVIE